MKLKPLEINCFRGINNLTIDFVTTEPTVFIGVNEVGKSITYIIKEYLIEEK